MEKDRSDTVSNKQITEFKFTVPLKQMLEVDGGKKTLEAPKGT